MAKQLKRIIFMKSKEFKKRYLRVSIHLGFLFLVLDLKYIAGLLNFVIWWSQGVHYNASELIADI